MFDARGWSLPLLSDLFSTSVSTDERYDDDEDVILFPAELEIVAAAVPERRAEFATARGCARRSLDRLGCPPSPITRGPRGSPMWPRGYVGTLTHCAGFRGSAVARTTTHLSLGLDCEPNAPLPSAVVDDVLLPREQELVERLAQLEPHVSWDRLLFCGKEATYKTWFPLAQQWLTFDEASVDLDPHSGRVRVELLAEPLVTSHGTFSFLGGRWTVCGGFVAVAVELPVPA